MYFSPPVRQRPVSTFTPAPLPIPTRRPTHRANPSLSDSDDGSPESNNNNTTTNTNATNHVMTQYPYQDADEDPLRHVPSLVVRTEPALCYALNVAKTAPSTARQLTKTYDLAVLDRTSPVRPTHLLAVHDAPLADPLTPVTLIPIDTDTFSRKLRVDLTGARVHPSTRVVSPPATTTTTTTTTRPPLPSTVRVPVVPLQVPHAPSVALLLLYALGVRADPSALAAALLPLSVAEEFPSAAAMAQAMAAQCERDEASAAADGAAAAAAVGGGGSQPSPLDWYMAHNQGMWKNVLALGLQDARVMSVVQTVWNVTAESRKISARQRDRQQQQQRDRDHK
ncbi:hypothetical protein BJV78DRAFT_1301322 [Lactifluus subvellereus]|nr:hypothetical protein BJV78DRAFT_1301322 [Lactifluus subvellereus]